MNLTVTVAPSVVANGASAAPPARRYATWYAMSGGPMENTPVPHQRWRQRPPGDAVSGPHGPDRADGANRMGDDGGNDSAQAPARRAGCRCRDPRSIVLELRRRVRHPAVRGDPTDPGPHDRASGRKPDHAATRDRGAGHCAPHRGAGHCAPHGGAGHCAPHGGPGNDHGAAHRGPGHDHGPDRRKQWHDVVAVAAGWPRRGGHRRRDRPLPAVPTSTRLVGPHGDRPRPVRRDHHASRGARAWRAGGGGQCRCREARHAHGFGPAAGGLGA